MTRSLAVPALILALAAGCARQPHPVVTPLPPKPGLSVLKADLARAFRAPAFGNAVWGVEIKSLRTGETFYALNPATFLMPASNMKVVTAAVAAERIGWAHTFETRLVSSGALENGVLAGDLVIVGAGDPSLGGRPGSAPAVLDRWANQLKAAGLTRIAGSIVGDDSVLDDEGLGQGWAWDYLGAAYATPTSGLSFNENTVQLRFTPGAATGDPVAIEGRPVGHGLTIVSAVVTGAKDSQTDVDFRRLPGSAVLTVTGSVPLGRADVTRSVSVDNPTMFTAGVVRAALIERGIAVDGEAVDIDALPAPQDAAGARTLATWTSPPLADILRVLLKVSQNLYADTMLELAGRAPGADGSAPQGSAVAGRKAVQETLATWGITPDRYLQADGSGLSRYNYITADLLVRVLTRVYEDPKHRDPFLEALPIAGVDGTIGSRMKGTKAENNARAKTGSIANARALSGFVTSADGEPLVFSIVVNNFNVPQSEADTIVDRVVARLAEFPAPLMLLPFLLYAAFTLATVGLISVVVPLRFLGVRNRWVAAAVAIAGMVSTSTVLSWPAADVTVGARASALDEFAPAYQFSERHEIPVRATAGQVYSALLTVSADEIPFYRSLVWVRRGGNLGPESILNPPDGVPLIRVATRTSFVTLANEPGVEYVMGTVVIVPPGVRLALGSAPESFKSLTQPGFAKATVGFRIEPRPDGWCLLRTETRVHATDDVSRATFARYWRVIAPGSALIRLMWLRAVKVRAETIALAPVVVR